VLWIASDPARRYPLEIVAPAAGVVLVGHERDRIQHYFPEGVFIDYEVAFLSAEGAILEVQRLQADEEGGVTSRMPARYALFVPASAFRSLGIAANDRVEFSQEIAARPPEPRPDVRVGGVPIRVEVSYRRRERERGLMRRRGLSDGEGMLFVYREEGPRSFYMLHCLFALDIAFFDREGALLTVVSTDPYPDPSKDTGERARSDGDARYVLETRKGWFAAHGLVGADGRPKGTLRLEMPDSVRRLAEEAD